MSHGPGQGDDVRFQSLKPFVVVPVPARASGASRTFAFVSGVAGFGRVLVQMTTSYRTDTGQRAHASVKLVSSPQLAAIESGSGRCSRSPAVFP